MFNRLRLASIVVVLAILSLSVCACGNTDVGQTSSTASNNSSGVQHDHVTCVSGNLQVTGSTALQPLVKDVATDYQEKCSGANITVGGGGSSTGLKNAQDGSSQIGSSDVFARKALYPNLVDNQVAVVTFSVVINGKVTNVDNLTSEQLQGIFTGKVKNWQEVGGPNLPIVAVSRPAGSGTRLTFEQYILHGPETITGNPVANASGEVATTVEQTDGAISYVASDFARKNELKIIKLDGIEENNANVENNTYKFWNIEHMYTKGPTKGLAEAFINYVKSPDTASYREKQGFLDISKMSESALKAKTPSNS